MLIIRRALGESENILESIPSSDRFGIRSLVLAQIADDNNLPDEIVSEMLHR